MRRSFRVSKSYFHKEKNEKMECILSSGNVRCDKKVAYFGQRELKL